MKIPSGKSFRTCPKFQYFFPTKFSQIRYSELEKKMRRRVKLSPLQGGSHNHEKMQQQPNVDAIQYASCNNFITWTSIIYQLEYIAIHSITTLEHNACTVRKGVITVFNAGFCVWTICIGILRNANFQKENSK